MSCKHSLRLLFLVICAIHLSECQYDSDDYSDDDYPPLLGKDKQNQNKAANTGTPDPRQPPKDFFIPSLSFVPYSKIKTAAIRQIDDASKTEQPTEQRANKKKKKKPCSHKSHTKTSQGDYSEDGTDGDEYGDTHDDNGYHTDSYSRKRRSHGSSHGKPLIRSHHSKDSRVRHTLPRVREVINTYTMDIVDP